MALRVTSKTIEQKFPLADLSSLPTSNPGDGKPWLSGGFLGVGNFALDSAAVEAALGYTPADAADLGAANGIATLDSQGRLTQSQIPDLSLVTYLGSVASQAAMLALVGQAGDWCTRSDSSTTWIITGSDPTQLSSWTQISYPTAPVTSVFGRGGAVTAQSTDYSGVGITNTAIGASNPSTGAFTTLSAISGTIAASTPALDASQTWNNAAVTFTGSKINITDTASASGSLLADWQVGGVSKLKIRKDGRVYSGDGSTSYLALTNDNGAALVWSGSSFSAGANATITSNNIGLLTSGVIWLGSTSTHLYIDSVRALGFRNSSNPYAIRIYNTSDADWTVTNNYERGVLDWQTTSNVFRIGTEAAGTGTVRNIALVGGNVGIGTTSPSVKLDVNGGILGSSATFNNADSSNTGIIVQPWVQVRNNSNTLTGYVSNGGSIFTSGASGSTDFGLRAIGSFGISTSNSVTPTLVINASGTSIFTPASLTGSASTSALDISQTWNTTGTPTAVKLNITDTASASGSLLADLQVGGVSKFKVDKNGATTISGDAIVSSGNLTIGSSGLTTNGLGGSGRLAINSMLGLYDNLKSATLRSTDSFGWRDSTNLGAGIADVLLYRDSAGVLAQRYSTTAQTFRIYNTFTDANNYERGKIAWESNAFVVGTEKAGSGSNRKLRLYGGQSGQDDYLEIDTTESYVTYLRVPYYLLFNSSPQIVSSYEANSRNNTLTLGKNGILIKSSDGAATPTFLFGYGASGNGWDAPSQNILIRGYTQNSTNVTNLTGGNISLLPGSGASGSAGAANGGNIYLDGGQGYGTGVHGSLYLGSTRLTSVYLTPTSLTGSQATSALDISQTWNTSGTPTLVKCNVVDTSSNAASLLMDLQVGGSSKFTIAKSGAVRIAATSLTITQSNFSNDGAKLSVTDSGYSGLLSSYMSAPALSFKAGTGIACDGCYIIGSGVIGWGTGNYNGSPNTGADTFLTRDASYIIAQRNSTNAQTFRLYGTYSDASNYERLALSSTTYSSAKYATIAAESAGTGAANINMVVSPKGTGAFMLQTPDGTATGGNARGTNAVDLSTDRSGNTFVASGSGSVISGGSNNKATAVNSVVAGGNSNAATGQYSVVGGGIYNTSSGYAAYTTGYENQATNTCSVGFGAQTLADRYNQFAIGCTKFSSAGDAQWCLFTLRIKTTDATATTLMLNGSSIRLTIPSGKVFAFVAKISGIKSDGSAVAFYTRKGCIKNVGGATSLVGSIETIGTDTEDNASTDVAITADDTNDALQINVTGIAAETWRWVAVVEGIEIGYGT